MKDKEKMRNSKPVVNSQKFREVLLYILHKMEGKLIIDKTLIYNFLYFIDFNFYEKYEEHFIGMRYKKNVLGPFTFRPLPIRFASLIKSMIAHKEVKEIKDYSYSPFPETITYVALRKPDFQSLSPEKISLIDEVLDLLSTKSSGQIMNYLSKDIPWKVTDDNKIIDYETVFYRTSDYSRRND